MTRNNLDEHLSWLLRAKASVPAIESLYPPATNSFTSIAASQDTEEETQEYSPIRPRPARVEASPVVPQPRPTTIEPPSIAPPIAPRPRTVTPLAPSLNATVQLQSDEMVRLRTVPGSASRQNLVSMGPELPRAAASTHDQRSPALPVRATSSTSCSTPRRQNTFSTARTAFKSPQNVEVMDLTESLGHMASPTAGRVAGRKRKSSEMAPDTPRRAAPCPRHGAGVHTTAVEPPPGSQQSFTAIDEIMDEQPLEPPPPYSTLAPGASTRNAATRNLGFTLQPPPDIVMPDSEEDDDDLINLSGHRRPRTKSVERQTAKQDTPFVANTSSLHQLETSLLDTNANATTPRTMTKPALAAGAQPLPEKSNSTSSAAAGISESDSALVAAFFALPTTSIEKAVDSLQQKDDNLVMAIGDRLEEGLDDKDLEEQRNDIKFLLDIVVSMRSRCDEYRRLCAEKQHLKEAVLHAVRMRQGKEAAQAANLAGKEALMRFEVKCCESLGSCKDEFERLVKDMAEEAKVSGPRKVAVHSTQAPAMAPPMREAVVPSSSRIAQTQMALPGARQPPLANASHYNATPTNFETYFSPSKVRPQDIYPRKAASHSAFDDEFDDVDDEAMFAASNQVFSNRMGTPPAPYHHDAEDDYGVGDDDDMLDYVDDAENLQQTYGSSSRPVFAEKSSNIQVKPNSTSAKKAKKTKAPAIEEDIEDFRFPWSKDVKETLKRRFALRGFRENQIQAINATLAGRDVFVLMPTGGGKSLCYQVPSLIKTGRTQGVTIIVSPLLSLMEDQVQHLRKLSIQAFVINGGTSQEEKNAIYQSLYERDVQDYVEILYVTPEFLSKSGQMVGAIERLYKRQRLARLVIDEAHCVSQWGHDFRPDYKLLGDLRKKVPDVPVMALTATATENVKIDVMHNLGIEGCEVLTSSFNRKNLFYEVRAKGKGKEDIKNIAEIIKDNHPKQTGIVYCFSRKNCEDVAQALCAEHDIKAAHYHAGVDADKKSKVQRGWQAGKYQVIVATIAFGMGIDKPDVRFVIHHSMAKSVEGYYQETGRAGRDGLPAHCYLFYGYQDATKMKRMIEDNVDGSYEQKERQKLMLRKMVQFCENKSDCRRVQVLGYFNEKFDPEDCELQCDNCNSNSTFEDVDYTEYAQQAVSLVRHVQQAVRNPEKERTLTILQCVDVLRGAGPKALRDEHAERDEWGYANSLDRGDVERLFYRLVNEDVLRENNVKNKSGFHTQYVVLGTKNKDYESGRRRLNMQIRSTPAAKSKAKVKKATKKQKETRTPALPLSTNVSSPIQAAATRKRNTKAAKQNTAVSGYEHNDFVVPDPEDDDDYAGCPDDDDDDDYSEDGFEPIRVAGKSRQEKTRAPRVPITTDATMECLDPIHRMYVDGFVAEAQPKAKAIMFKKDLKKVPFSDTMLRHMAIHYTDTPEKMAQIPDINQEYVELYGKEFFAMVKNIRRQVLEAQDEEEAPDPHSKNVIDLVSESEEEDEYGSIDIEDEQEDDGEPSAYFPPQRVQQFNAQFVQSQSAAMRTVPEPARQSQGHSKRRSPKGKKKIYARVNNRSEGGGRSRRSDEGAGGPARVTKRRAPGKRSTSGGKPGRFNGGRGGGGGGGISMMPT